MRLTSSVPTRCLMCPAGQSTGKDPDRQEVTTAAAPQKPAVNKPQHCRAPTTCLPLTVAAALACGSLALRKCPRPTCSSRRSPFQPTPVCDPPLACIGCCWCIRCCWCMGCNVLIPRQAPQQALRALLCVSAAICARKCCQSSSSRAVPCT